MAALSRADGRRMRRSGRKSCLRAARFGGVMLAVALAGCNTTDVESVRHFNDDGVYLFERGEYRGAKESFETALAIQPHDANLLYNLGQCCHRQNEMAKAEKYYRQCLQTNTNHADCRHALVVLLLWDGRRREAEELIDDWLSREPKRPDPYVEDAWRLRQNGQLEQAKGRLQQALALDPRHVRGLTELGILYEVEQRPDHALVLYERALQISPERGELVARANHLRSKGIRPLRPD
jgi:Tfp pilus assembly protein PilF